MNAESLFDLSNNFQLDGTLSQLLGTEAYSSPMNFVDAASSVEVKKEEEKEDKKTKGKRGKKRQRKDSKDQENTDVSAVQLTREQLLTISSAAFDDFVNRVTSARSLTNAEEKEVKRQRRLIKNRESAQASRHRKKEYVDELEAEIAQLKNQNTQLTNQVGHLFDENKSLREELQQLHTLVKKTGLSGPWDFKQTASEIPQKIKTAGVCLLIIMFSFGLFLGNGPAAQPFLQNGRPFHREPVPNVLPSTSIGGAIKVWPVKRELLQVFPEEPTAVSSNSEEKKRAVQSIQHDRESQHQHKIVINDKQAQQTKSMPAHMEDPVSDGSSHKRKFGEIQEADNNDEVRTNLMAEFMNESSPSNISNLSENSEVAHFFSERLKQQPNTAFFTCSDFHQIVPPSPPHYDPESPLFLSLLVPARTLPHQGRILSSEDTTEDTAIEIHCQIVGINHTNFDLPPLTVSS
jgi:regulator of replication initiation timing